MKKLLLKNLRDVLTRKSQFTAIIVLVALGVASYVSLVSAYLNLGASYQTAKEKLKLADFTISVNDASASVVNNIAAIGGVRAVQGRLIVDTGLEISRKSRGTARIVGIPTRRHPKVDNIMVKQGRYLTGPDDQQALVDNYFAETSHKRPGDTMNLIIQGKKTGVKIRGVAVTPEYLFPIRTKEELPTPGQLAVVFMAQEEVEFLFRKDRVYNDFAVLLKPGADPEKVIRKVQETLEPFTVVETIRQKDQPSNFRLQEEVRQNRELSDFMPPLILIISSLSLYIALSRLVQSQRGIIGLAKALGYSNLKLLFHYLVFALLIAFWGSVLGFALGYWLGAKITELYADFLRLPFFENNIYFRQAAAAAGLSLITSALGGLVPAYASARMPPATAMRADPNLLLSKAGIPLVERFIGVFFRLPFSLKVPLRNVFRVKKRSVYTITGIVFALILTTATWASFDSIDYLINYQFKQVDNWDLTAIFERFIDADEIGELENFKGIEQAQPALQLPARVGSHGKTHETIVTAKSAKADFHGFNILRGNAAEKALAKNGLIMPEKIAEKLELRLGEQVSIKSPYNEETQTVVLRSISEEALGAPIFIHLKVGRKLVNSKRTLFNALYVNVAEGRAAAVERKLFDQPDVSQVIVKSELIDNIEAQMEFANTSFIIMLAFAFSVAFVITYNTLTTNVLERSRELATMRTIGEDLRHLALSITVENLFLALIGIPLGIYLGVEAANAMFDSFSTEAYSLKAVMYPLSYLWVTLSILVVLLISEVPAIRRISRLDLAEATKVLD